MIRVHPRRTSAFTTVGGAAALPSSTCFDLDATNATSTGTANEWKNVITSPNDGASQTDYDFYLGTSSASDGAEPTLTGTGDAKYFNLDGGDYFTAKQTTNAKIFNGAHKTSGTDSGAKWLVMALRGPAGGINADVFWGNTDGDASDHCMRMLANSGGNLRLYTAGGDGVNFQNAEIQAATYYDDTEAEIVLAWTWDATSTGSEKTWSSSSTGDSWTTAFAPETSSTNATNAWQFAAGEASFPLSSGTRIYSIIGGNSLLTDGEMADIITVLNARHSAFSI